MDPNHVPAGRNSDSGRYSGEGPGVRRLAAVLLVAGLVLSFGFGALHPGEADPNDHAAAFAEYARSDLWTGVHLGQFVGMAALVGGLLVLGTVAGGPPGRSAWAARFGNWAAAASLALYGALQAVDGVALKHSADAWAASGGAEKAVRFAAAEDMRWLEWGMRSYQSFVLGAALLLLGLAVGSSPGFPRPVGYLMGLSGAAYMAQGWIIGTEGFSGSNTVPTLAGIALDALAPGKFAAADLVVRRRSRRLCLDWDASGIFPVRGSGMTDSKRNAEEPSDLQGPGDPDAVEQQQPHPEAGTAHNIREEQMTQAGGIVPPSYMGSGAPEGGHKPEEAAGESGLWDGGDT